VSYLSTLLIRWSGSENEAISWLQEEEIPAFGNKTGLDMCNSNQPECFIEYVKILELDGFA